MIEEEGHVLQVEGQQDEGFFCSPKDILVPEGRARKNFSENVLALMNSIRDNGLIHPLVVTQTEGWASKSPRLPEYTLVAGECRYRAVLMLGWPYVRVTLKDNLSPVQRKEIELEENLRRKDFEWPEEVELVRQLDQLKKKKAKDSGKKWTTREDTANTLGVSRAHAAKQVRFAKLMKERPDLLSRLRGLSFNVAMQKFDDIMEAERLSRVRGSTPPEGDIKVVHGDCVEELSKLPDSSVDLVLTDPPTGIESLEGTGGQVAATRDATDNLTFGDALQLMDRVIPEIFRVLKEGRHFYIFFSFPQYPRLVDILQRAGLFVYGNPLIWYKDCTTTAPMGQNYPRSYESILYGYKPLSTKEGKKRKLTGSLRDVLIHKPIPSGKRIHVFEKPSSLLKELITHSSRKGEMVLDPFAGSGSTLLACQQLERRALGIEVNKEHYVRICERIDPSSGKGGKEE